MHLVRFGFTNTIISPNNVGFPKKNEKKEAKKARALPENKGTRRFYHTVDSDILIFKHQWMT